MSAIARDGKSAALLSLVLVTPFAVLESLHMTLTRPRLTDFAALFAMLWLMPALVVLALAPLLRDDATPRSQAALRIGIALGLAAIWGTILADQMPCFLGIPNCD